MTSSFRAALLAFCVALAAVLFTSSLPPANATELTRFSRTEVHMAVDFEVVLYAADAATADRALTAAMARIAALDKALSDYDTESELSKLSETSVRKPGESSAAPPVKLSGDLWSALLHAQQISRASGGAFDVTIGPLTKLWRRARRWKQLPEADALAAAKATVGFQYLKLNASEHSAQLLKPNMRLDLGGIAKGFAADEAVAAVKKLGISRLLVRASGDIAIADPPPDEAGWRIGIAPLNPDEAPSRFVELANCGISTSGDARQHLVVDGRRYSHIIDPRTGEPVSGRSSVTVIAPNATLADGLATAASVLGPDQALEVTNLHKATELLMVSEDETGKKRAVESRGFRGFEVPR